MFFRWLAAFTIIFFFSACEKGSFVKRRPAQSPPNILYIFTDDQSHRTVRAYAESHSWVKTPNLDRLAKEGVLFTHAYHSPWCVPSRLTALTGMHSWKIQSFEIFPLKYPYSKYDPSKLKFWPESFRKNGYFTVQIGKWHTGVDSGFGRDWDAQYVWNRPKHYKTAGDYYGSQKITINGMDKDIIHQIKSTTEEGYPTDQYTSWAEGFIRNEDGQRPITKPWYLWLTYGAAHGPFIPASRHKDAYAEIKLKIPKDIYQRDGKPAYMSSTAVGHFSDKPDPQTGEPIVKKYSTPTLKKESFHGRHYRDWLRAYHQTILAVDEGVGRLIRALDETGQRENTLVVFTSDQGLAFGQHGFIQKLAPYDASMRVPLIFSQPGTIPSNRRVSSPVSGVDVVETFFSVSGIHPWKTDGRDLSPLLKGGNGLEEKPLLMVHHGSKFGSKELKKVQDSFVLRKMQQGIPWWLSTNDGKFKYIRTLVEGEMEELYNIKDDPAELKNLALDPSMHSVLVKYRHDAISLAEQEGLPFAQNLPSLEKSKWKLSPRKKRPGIHPRSN